MFDFRRRLSLFVRSNLFTESCQIAYGAGPMAEPAVGPSSVLVKFFGTASRGGSFPAGHLSTSPIICKNLASPPTRLRPSDPISWARN